MSETRCFFDITINNIDAGRIIFELFANECPKTSENFRQLCTGEAGIGKIHEKQLYYKGIIFHRVVKGFMIQSGDFINSNGTGGESIYGKIFDDENLSLKHDKPFLLSMANRGKNTNSSQFFITTAPASHLDGIHTIFGRVVSGQDVVRQIESLPVDRNSRPLDEVMVKNCGELVKQVKEKKVKKNKKKIEVSDSSDSTSSDSSSEDEKKKKRKKKKENKKSKKTSKHKDSAESSIEEGELESDTEGLNPLVSVTKIDPNEIPEVNNRFLMRSEKLREDDDKNRRSEDRNGNENRREKNFGWSKRYVPQSRSGRIIKGRGSFRYHTPSRSRSRSFTPEHWKAATRKLIKFSEFEKLEEEKRQREDEIKRRTEERKKRHEAISRGDGKKSFFELGQETKATRAEIESTKEPEKLINDELDYEADDIVEEPENPEKKRNENDQKTRRIEKSRTPDRKRNIRRRSRSRSRDFDRRNRDRRDFLDYRRRQNEGRRFERNNRFDRFRRDDKDRDRYLDNFGRNRNYRDFRERERDRRRSRSRSRSRRNRRRSDDRNSNRKRSLSPSQTKKSEEVTESSKNIEENPKTKYNENDIEDLERRVLEAKKVLEIIVKEKEKEEEENRKRSLSRSSKRSDKKKKRRHSDSSD